jgi:hypothetical protein
MKPLRKETYRVADRMTRLRQLGAQYRKDKTANPNRSLIYWIPRGKLWAMEKMLTNGTIELTIWSTCPCATTQATA